MVDRVAPLLGGRCTVRCIEDEGLRADIEARLLEHLGIDVEAKIE